MNFKEFPSRFGAREEKHFVIGNCQNLEKISDTSRNSSEAVFFFADQSSVSGSSGSAHPVLELNQQRPVFRNYRLLMNGTLFISKASENDEAKFICEADNGVNEPIGKMVTLKINGMCTLISGPCIHFRFSLQLQFLMFTFTFLASARLSKLCFGGLSV